MEIVSHLDLTSFYQRYNPTGEAMNCHLNISPVKADYAGLKRPRGISEKKRDRKP